MEKKGRPRDECVQPARGPIGLEAEPGPRAPTARPGKPAPDFEANAFVGGGFKNVKLSDYRGHWVMLCFYPGDFTFV